MDPLKKYFPELNQKQLDQFAKLEMLYRDINQQVNVVSRKDIDNIVVHHFLPALAIAKIYKFEKDENVLDIGTGGGLPGIPLAIYFPKTNFTLVDSIYKKIRVVQKIVDELGLKNVTATQSRSNELEEKFDFVVGRGVSEPGAFVKLAKKNLKNKNNLQSIYYISGGEEDTEFNKVTLANFFPEDYFKNKYVYL